MQEFLTRIFVKLFLGCTLVPVTVQSWFVAMKCPKMGTQRASSAVLWLSEPGALPLPNPHLCWLQVPAPELL